MTSVQVLPSRTASGLSVTSVRTSQLANFLLAGYIVCMPIQIDTGVGFRFAPSDVFLFLYVLCMGASLRWARPDVWNLWLILVPFAFVLSSIVAVIRTGEVTRYALFNKDGGVLVFLITYGMLTAEATDWSRIRQILRLFILSVAVMNTLALAAYLDIVPWLSANVFVLPYTGRLSGMLIDPNAYGGLLVVAFAAHATTFLSPRPLLGGVPGLFTVVSLLTGILYTYSRSAWISVIAMLLMLSMLRPKIAVAVLASFAVAVVTIVMVVPPDTLYYMTWMATRPTQVDSRVDTALYAVPEFLQNPIFGMGLGTFQESYDIIIHNTLLWFLTEFGLIGFAIFVGFYAHTLITGVRTFRLVEPQDRELILGLLVGHVAILGLSMGIEAFYQRHWWLVVAMLASARALTRGERSALHSHPVS